MSLTLLLGSHQATHSNIDKAFEAGITKIKIKHSEKFIEVLTLPIWEITSLLFPPKVEGKRCKRCNRPISHPDSLKSGYGRECEEKIKTESLQAIYGVNN